MYSLSIINCSKNYGDIKVLKDINLKIEESEFLTLLGPSGCGKSTLLKIIAGLEFQSSGTIEIKQKDVSKLTPNARNISMVFQSYALYPHMSVYENIATPLKMRNLTLTQKIPFVKNFMKQSRLIHEKIDREVKLVAEKLNINQLLNRKPSELSGGQKQRVAIGRAMVRKPDIFLMDEPLSNLDAKLRVQMRTELAALHRELKETFVYVTHDQEEAMTMSDKIAVMMDGEILQVDTPHNIYINPNHIKVAEFIGSPKINILKALCINSSLNIQGVDLAYRLINQVDEDVLVGIRPECFKIHGQHSNKTIPAVIEHIENLGSHFIIYVILLESREHVVIKTNDVHEYKIGDKFYLETKNKKIMAFCPKSGIRLDGEKYVQQ